MSDLRQYDLARLASHAWPRCAYRLVRQHDNDADAPAVFQVMNRTRDMGRLVIRTTGLSFHGDTTLALDDALAVVADAVSAATRTEARPCA